MMRETYELINLKKINYLAVSSLDEALKVRKITN